MKATADEIFNLVAAFIADGSARRPICSRQTPKQIKIIVSCNVIKILPKASVSNSVADPDPELFDHWIGIQDSFPFRISDL